MKYLDENGLSYLWQKIKAVISKTTGIPTNGIIEYEGDTIPEGYEEVEGQEIEIIHGTTTATTDSVGRILVPIPLNSKCESARCRSHNYFAILRSINTTNSQETLCYIKDPDKMTAITNVEVTVDWSYLKEV